MGCAIQLLAPEARRVPRGARRKEVGLWRSARCSCDCWNACCLPVCLNPTLSRPSTDDCDDASTTPADVIKTRLQTEAKKGETHYKGVVDAFRKICTSPPSGYRRTDDLQPSQWPRRDPRRSSREDLLVSSDPVPSSEYVLSPHLLFPH